MLDRNRIIADFCGLQPLSGVLCLSCGGLCRPDEHVPFAEPSDDGHLAHTYSLVSPVPFRVQGLIVCSESFASVESLRIGNNEVLVAPIPGSAFTPPLPFAVYAASIRDGLFACATYQLSFPVVERFCRVTVVTSGAVADFGLYGRYLQPV